MDNEIKTKLEELRNHIDSQKDNQDVLLSILDLLETLASRIGAVATLSQRRPHK